MAAHTSWFPNTEVHCNRVTFLLLPMHVLVNFGFWLEVLLENKPKLHTFHTFPLILPCFIFVVCQPFGSCATERWKIGFKSCKSMVDCFNSSLVSAPCSLLVYLIRNQGTAISTFIMQLY